jgi:hypothetical protein
MNENIRCQWEDKALAVVSAVKRDLVPAMDDNDGGQMLVWILNLVEEVSSAKSASQEAQIAAQHRLRAKEAEQLAAQEAEIARLRDELRRVEEQLVGDLRAVVEDYNTEHAKVGELEAELSAVRQAILGGVDRPDWDVKAIVALAQAHRQDSEDRDEAESGVSGVGRLGHAEAPKK